MAMPTLLLCIGATKAGTTWLYDYLRKHPDCHLQSVKELHYFDTRKGENRDFYLQHVANRKSELSAKTAGSGLLKRRKLAAQQRSVAAWAELLEDPGADHSKYWRFLTNGVGTARLVADVTPCYATLERNDFAEMAGVAEDVRFLFLLRDPVDRAWSQARMNGVRRSLRYSKRAAPEAARKSLHRFLDAEDPGFTLRSDYARTLRAVLDAVPRERVHLEFYEHLFTPEALQRLTAFLDISDQTGELGKVRHAGSELEIDAEDAARAADALKDQYSFCDTFFEGRLPARWRAHMMEA